MEWLNYNHLYYFFVTVREGGVTAAARFLNVTQPTVSGQLRSLEQAIGSPLFRRSGRSLALTDGGKLVYRYASDIFELGEELRNVISGAPRGKATQLVVGVATVLPKLLVQRFLRPALDLRKPLRLVCQEDRLEKLLSELATHSLDLVLADSPISPTVSLKGYNHALGESTVSFFGTKELVEPRRRNFPQSLDGAPILLPTSDTVLRRSLDDWFKRLKLSPKVVGEFHDSALLKAFGQAGDGVFPAPSVIEREVKQQYGVHVLGLTDEIRERYYAITVERRITHPGLVAISRQARQLLELKS